MFYKSCAIGALLLSCTYIFSEWQSVDASATRNKYKEEIVKHNAAQPISDCVFCNEGQSSDDEHYFILKRFTYVYVELNPYPYRQGHMLIVPYRHVAKLQDLTEQERSELIEVTALAMRYLNEEYKTDGINMGINEGRAAGASKPDHLHVQIVPRWTGDTGWFNIIGQTGIIAESMQDTYRRLRAKFA